MPHRSVHRSSCVSKGSFSNHCLMKNYTRRLYVQKYISCLPRGEPWERPPLLACEHRQALPFEPSWSTATYVLPSRASRRPARKTLITRATPGVKSRPPWGQHGEAHVLREGARFIIVSPDGNDLKVLGLRRHVLAL